MAHLKPEIVYGPYWAVETTEGTQYFPGDLAPRGSAAIDFARYVDGESESAERHEEGLLARLSAPGYLDCTEWSVYPCLQAARDGLAESYGVPQCALCRELMPEETGDECPACAAGDWRAPHGPDPDPIRIVRFETGPGFTLVMFDACESKGNKRAVGYLFFQNGSDEPIFQSTTHSVLWSPNAIDGDDAAAALCSFLFLRPGDTDAEYFESYTPDQLDFAATWAEHLSCDARDLFGDR